MRTVGSLRQKLHTTLALEGESHKLWDESFTNITFSNLSGESRQKYINRTYDATRKHAQAVELLEAVIEDMATIAPLVAISEDALVQAISDTLSDDDVNFLKKALEKEPD